MTAKCRVHGRKLLTDVAEIRSGMPPAPPDDYLEAVETFFPNANTWVMGGCVISFPEVMTEAVEYCPDCRIALNGWWEGRSGDDFWTP
jgi:hypothetical protein